jgi:hypothetical protein
VRMYDIIWLHFVHLHCPDQQIQNICYTFVCLGNKLYKMHGTVHTSKYTFLLFSFVILLSIGLPVQSAFWQTCSFKVTSILYKRKYALKPMRRRVRKRTHKHIPDKLQHLKVIYKAAEVPWRCVRK